MQKHPHSVRSFDAEINDLNQRILTMARACKKQLAAMKKALTEHDAAAGRKIAQNDESINALHHEIEAAAIKMLTRRQPVAQDLRHVLTVMKISRELERIGDYVGNVSRRVADLARGTFKEPEHMLVDMAGIADGMLERTIEAFLDFDVEEALAVWQMDDDIDGIYAALVRLVQKEMTTNSDSIPEGTEVNFMARCLERIGDHIINMAEEVYFMATGKNFTPSLLPARS